MVIEATESVILGLAKGSGNYKLVYVTETLDFEKRLFNQILPQWGATVTVSRYPHDDTPADKTNLIPWQFCSLARVEDPGMFSSKDTLTAPCSMVKLSRLSILPGQASSSNNS